MSRNTSLALVALLSFAGGIAIDRLLLPFTSGSGRSPTTSSRDSKSHSNPHSRNVAGAPDGHPGSRQNRPPSDARGEKRDGPRKHAEEREEDRRFPTSVRQILEQLERGGRIDFQRAAQLLEKMPPSRGRHEAIARISSHWGARDPLSAIAWADQLVGPDKFIALEHILHEWARRDPAAASAYVTSLPRSEHSLNMVRRMAHLWSEHDRPAALEWSMAQEDPATRQRALGGVVHDWSRTDPAAAAEFAAGIEGVFERREAIEVAARHWAHQSTDEALEWARTLPEGDRQRATHAVLREIAERDPQGAAALYDELTAEIPEGSLKQRDYRHLAQSVASVWSSSNPVEAANWAVGLPETGDVRRGAVSDVVERWLRQDSMAAGQWVLQLPPGGTRDEAASRIVHSMSSSDPEAAFAWAASVREEGHRNGLMHHVLEQWSALDPAAAQAALNTAQVSPEARRHFDEVFRQVAPPPLSSPPEPDNGQKPEPGGTQDR